MGLAEVNTAVNQMDQVTQQNAAMVEEANAAGATLASESAKLKELVEQFRLVNVSAVPGARVVIRNETSVPSPARAHGQRAHACLFWRTPIPRCPSKLGQSNGKNFEERLIKGAVSAARRGPSWNKRRQRPATFVVNHQNMLSGRDG